MKSIRPKNFIWDCKDTKDSKMEIWSFPHDELFDLVKCGRKTATCCLNLPGANIAKVKKSNGERITIQTTAVSVRHFSDIDNEWAKKEGEGDLSLDNWKKVHREFFIKECAEHGLNFDENIKLECEEFVVV